MSSTPAPIPGRGKGGKSINVLNTLMAKKGVRRSGASKAGMVFPVARVKRYLRRFLVHGQKYISIKAAVYLAAVLEYMAFELLELSMEVAKGNGKKRITPRHILIAVKKDPELESLLRGVMITDGGVAPFLDPRLR